MDYFKPVIYKRGNKWVVNNRKLHTCFSKYEINTQEEMVNYLLGLVADNENFVADFINKLRSDPNHIEKFSYYDKNNKLFYFVITSFDLKERILSTNNSWKSYALNKFSEYTSDEYIESNKKRAYKILFDFESNSRNEEQRYFSRDDNSINNCQIDSDFEEKILNEVPDCFSKLQKTYYVYKRLCQIFSYDEESFIFYDNDSLTTINHRDIKRLSKLKTGDDVVCYEFGIVFSKFLEKLGVSYKLVDYYGASVNNYGDGHMQVKFMVDNYVVDADAATGIYGSDMSLEKSFGIVNNFKLDDDYCSVIDKLSFKSELDVVDKYLDSVSISGELSKIRDIYYNMDVDDNLSREEKMNLLIDCIKNNNMKFVDIFQWVLYLSKKIFKSENLSSYRVEFVINNHPVQKKRVELALLLIYNPNSSIFDNSDNNKYIVITSDRKSFEYDYKTFVKKFSVGDLQMMQDRRLDNFERDNIDNKEIKKLVLAKDRKNN